ncbi:MAG: phage protease [Methylococcales bacterium]
MNITSLTLALKTNPSDKQNQQWVHLVPSGQFKARDGRGPWQLNDADGVIEATKQYAGKNLLPVDYEHQTELTSKNGQPAPAAGWIEGLQSRDDGIWGLVQWTEKAAAFLTNKEYKYLSPIILYTNNGDITRIKSAALTNNPALEMTALAKAEDTMNEDKTEETPGQDLSALKKLLSLEDEATMSDIVAAIQNMLTATNSVQPSPSEFVPLGEFTKVVSELQNMNENKVLAKVEDAINTHLLPASLKEWGVSMCQHDSNAFDEFVGSIGVIHGFMTKCQTSRLTAEERAVLDSRTQSSSNNEINNALGHSQEDIEKYSER